MSRILHDDFAAPAGGGSFIAAWALSANPPVWGAVMRKNVAGQKIGVQMVSATDGSAFTGAVTVAVTGDAGTQATGSVGSGACTHEGNGYHTYAPAQAETNYTLVAFTFTGTGAVPVTVQVFTVGYDPTVASLPATMSDGVTHGGSTAKLELGSASSTPALLVQNSGGSAARLLASGGNGHGLESQGNGSGEGISALGGDTGHGIEASSGSVSGDGIRATASNAGSGLRLEGAGGASFAGLYARAGSANTHGMLTEGSSAGAGIRTVGGTTGDGIKALGGATSGDGIDAEGQGTGVDIRGDITGNLTGNVSGSVATVTTIDEDSTTLDIDATVRAALGLASANLDTQLADLPTNAELATSQAAADDATLAAIAALNNLSAAQVNTEVDTALTDIHLDHLLATTYDPASKPGAADALLNELVESDGGVARYTANALEQAPTGGSAPSAADIADAVWDEDATAHQTQGTFGQAIGDPAADSDTIWALVNTNLNATVGSRATQTSVDDLPTNAELATALAAADDAVLAAIAALNNLSQANIRTAVGLGSANLDTQLDALPTNAELSTALGTADDAILAAIAALNNLSAAQVTAAVPTAAQNATGLLDLAAGVETGLTFREAMRLIAAASAGELSGAATSTVVIRNAVADSKDRITATVDGSGNRSAVVVDLT